MIQDHPRDDVEETERSFFVGAVRHGQKDCNYVRLAFHFTYVCPGCENVTCWCNGTADSDYCDGCTVLMWGKNNGGRS